MPSKEYTYEQFAFGEQNWRAELVMQTIECSLPLVLYGEKGSGKTHLLHVAAKNLAVRKKVQIEYGRVPTTLEGIDVLCIDNAHRIPEQSITQLLATCKETRTKFLITMRAENEQVPYREIIATEFPRINILPLYKKSEEQTKQPSSYQPAIVRTLIQLVAEHYQVKEQNIITKRGIHRYTEPKQVAMYLTRTELHHSLTQIGLSFRRDHTTVLEACEKINQRIIKDTKLAQEIASLRKKIGSEIPSTRTRKATA